MRALWICLLLATWATRPGGCQALVSGADILASAHLDPAVYARAQQAAFVQTHQKGLPFVEGIGARTETDRFELRRQEYLARVNVNGINEMRRQRQVQQADLRAEASKGRLAVHEALLERYETLADYVRNQRAAALQQQLRTVYEDQVLVLQKMAAAGTGTDVADLIKAEYDRDELTLKIAESEAEHEMFRQRIRWFLPILPADWQLDTAGFVAIDQIGRIVGELPLTNILHPEAQAKQDKIGQIDARFALRKAESQQVLDFFQLRYHNRPEDGFNRAFSVGFGVTLPYKGSDKVKLAELQIEKNAESLSLQQFQAETAARIEGARQHIGALQQRYHLARQQWTDSQARFTLDQARAGQTEGPWALLKARELQLKRQLALLDIERDMLGQYLNVLDWSGALSAAPAVNYLSDELKPY